MAALLNGPDAKLPYAIVSGNLSLWPWVCADGADVILSQFGVAIAGTAKRIGRMMPIVMLGPTKPAPMRPVHVFKLRSPDEMLLGQTEANVATVADLVRR